jgi:hypothetical protein
MRIASKAADRVEDQIDGANITQATVAFGLHRGELGFNATYRRSEPFQCVLKACATHDVQRTYKDHRGVNLISDALPFGRLSYAGQDAVSNAIGYAKFYSLSHRAVIRVYDDAGKLIEVHRHKGDFKKYDRP